MRYLPSATWSGERPRSPRPHLLAVLGVALLVTLPTFVLAAIDLYGVALRGFVEGGLTTDLQWDDRAEREENELDVQGTFRLSGEYVWPRLHHVLLKASIQGRWDALDVGDAFHGDLEVRLYETYVHLALPAFDLRVGRQIVAWGRAEEINPTDNFNPQDLRWFLTLDREERKIPIWAIRVDVPIGESSLQGVWSPVFERSRLAGPRTDWETARQRDLLELSRLAGVGIERQEPDANPRDSTAGIRVRRTFGGWDVSASYLYGWNYEPTARLFGLPPSPTIRVPPRIVLTHDRLHVFGIDFSTEYRGIGVKGEVAYFRGRHFPLTLSSPKPDKVFESDFLQYVVGADYFWEGRTYGIFQFIQEVILQPVADLDTRTLRSLLTLELRDRRWRDRLEYALRAIYSITDRDYYLRARLRYDLRGGWAALLGLDIFGGGHRRMPLGQFNKNDQVSVQLRYDF